MSVHSTTAARFPAGSLSDHTVPPAFPRHVVTAVLVAHDGARWLPDALAGLLGQERPVQNAVAADTGSTDDSARLLADALGDDRVLHLARRAGFGTAVDEAVRAAPVPTVDELPYLRRSSGWDPVGRTWSEDDDGAYTADLEPVQWLWLLHDDCAPEPGALHELLRVADAEITAGRPAAVVGPKLRSWYDRRQLLEVGVSIARSGRRWTGLERREQDQGQHDQVRQVLAVSSAGMLVRRDVWEQLGGFDQRLPLMRDDVDLCWRASAAGHRVLVAPEAVLRHAEAAARERRPVDCAGRKPSDPHKVDKAGAVYTLLANTRGALLPYVMLRVVLSTLLRTLGYLVGKAPGQALDEVAGLMATLLRPGRIRAARKRRGQPSVTAGELRTLFPPPGATVRVTVEQLASDFGAGKDDAAPSAGRHGAVESGPGGDDADYLEVEQFARLRRIARKPAPVLFAVLLLVSAIACRGLFGGGALSGGALLPVPDGASALWAGYTDGWHPVGTGTTAGAPPYLAVLAALSTFFLGSTSFTLTLLLVCSVPLAGLTAYFASRPLVESRLLRAWASVAYAFLPAATGALATGRLGTAVLAVVLPLMARAAVSAAGLGTPGARPSWRACWAYALLLTVTMSFTPVVWPLAVVFGLGVLVLRCVRGGAGQLTAQGPRLLAVILTPVAVLAPWSLGLFTHPARFLGQAGLDLGHGSASPLGLLTGDPGGPKTGAFLLTGVVLAALAALLRSDRQFAVRTAWAVALTGLLCAVLGNKTAWAGPATLVYGLALIAAAVVGAEGARERVAAQSFGWRQPVAGLIVLAAGAAPLVAAVAWTVTGADGPLARRDPAQVPAFVAEEAGTRDQARTLVLGGDAAHVAYTLVRGAGARMGDAELSEAAGRDGRLDSVVANLVGGSGADQAGRLADYAVGYVLVRDNDRTTARTVRVLDATPGLTRLSQEGNTALWRVDRQVARVTVVGGTQQDGGLPVPVAAGPVTARATLPAGSAGRVLRIADKAAPGWKATLNGKALKRTTVDGWAQGFTLPTGGGKLSLTYETPVAHTAWMWGQGLLALLLVVLALPGRRRRVDDDLPETGAPPAAAPAAATVPEQPVPGEGRRARRLRAAAAAAAVPEQAPPAEAPAADPYEEQAPADPYAAVPHQQPYTEYGEWDAQNHPYQQPGYGTGYDQGYDPSYPAQPQPQQYDPQGQVPYPQDPYAAGSYGQYDAYDPYGHGHQQPHRDGSEQQ